MLFHNSLELHLALGPKVLREFEISTFMAVVSILHCEHRPPTNIYLY